MFFLQMLYIVLICLDFLSPVLKQRLVSVMHFSQIMNPIGTKKISPVLTKFAESVLSIPGMVRAGPGWTE